MVPIDRTVKHVAISIIEGEVFDFPDRRETVWEVGDFIKTISDTGDPKTYRENWYQVDQEGIVTFDTPFANIINPGSIPWSGGLAKYLAG